MSDNTPTPVDAVDPAKKSSPILDSSSGETTVKMDQQDNPCFWNDAEFSQGDLVAVDGKCYECSFGRWVEQD